MSAGSVEVSGTRQVYGGIIRAVGFPSQSMALARGTRFDPYEMRSSLGAGQWQVSTGGGVQAMWAPTGNASS